MLLAKQKFLPCLLIFLFALALRLFFIAYHPFSLNIDEQLGGYESYSLLKTGKDMHGNPWPVHAFAFGWGDNVVYYYLLMPLIKIFGLNDIVVRLPAAIFGALAVLLTYFLAKELTNRKVALFSAALIAISPWALTLSRLAYNVCLLPFFYALAAYLLIYGIKRKKNLAILLSGPVFALTLYIYALSFLWLPLFYLIIFIVYFRDLKRRACFYFSLLLFLLAGLPIILFYLKNQFGLIGLEQIGPFSLPDLITTRFNMVSVFRLDGFEVFSTFILAYLEHLSPFFFFLDMNLKIFPPYVGIIYLFELPFLLFGLLYLWQRYKYSREAKLLLFWFFLFPIPAAFTIADIPHPLRAVCGLPMVSIISALGLVYLWQKLKSPLLFKRYAVFAVLNIIYFFGIFVFVYPVTSREAFMASNKEAIDYVREVYNDYDAFYFAIPHFINEVSFINLLYIFQFDPAYFQKQAVWHPDKMTLQHFDKFYFADLDNLRSLKPSEGKALYVVREQVEIQGRVVERIYYAGGQAAFKMVAR